MNQVYTLEQLESYNRTQLWEICRTNGLKCYPKTADCMKAICALSESVEKVAVASIIVDEQAVAEVTAPEQPKTCAKCPLFKPFNDGTGRGLCCGSDQVARDHHAQTQDCLHLIDSQQAETQIPGYDFCYRQGIQFKQRVGSETGTTYWYAESSHYYNQPGRQYKTGGFEKLENAVKAAITYLGKCGVDVAELKEQIIEGLRDKESAKPAIQFATVAQSGYLTFKKALSPNPAKTVYEVFYGVDSLGIVIKNENGDWCSSDSTDKHATPYEAAAALLKTNPTNPTADTVMTEIEVDSDIDPDFGTLYRVWGGNVGINLLGTFYRSAEDKWIAQPCNSEDRPRCNTAASASMLIMAMSGSLVADSPEDVTELLDKPFDELTSAEWSVIKQQAKLAELVVV